MTILLVLLILGAISFVGIQVLKPLETVEKPTPEHNNSVQYVIRSNPWINLGIGFSMTLMTVSLYELLNLVFRWLYWRSFNRDRAAFDAFFGDGASDNSGAGIIVLQADNINNLLEEYRVGNLQETINKTPTRRLYKAREWVNFLDIQGAQALVEAFNKLGLDAPTLLPMRRGSPGYTQALEQAPFIITMGLAFTQETVELVQKVGKNWMFIETTPEFGDVVELWKSLVPFSSSGSKFKSSDKHTDFVILSPKNWNLANWVEYGQKAANKEINKEDIDDYAIILRHTDTDKTSGKRQVRLVLAGFTERGTAAAGAYLAKHWKSFRDKNVKNQYISGSLGDFMLVIRGPSYWENIQEWEEHKELIRITPKSLKDLKVVTPWAERMK